MQRLLLALLISANGDTVSTGGLIVGLWGDEPPATARKTLQVYVHRLREHVGEALRTVGGGYHLDTGGHVDAVEFEQMQRSARDLLDVDPARASEQLGEALALWQGHAYADLEHHLSLAAEIARLEELRISVLGDRVDADLASGADQELIGELEGLTHEYPTQERFRAQHMTALYRAGRHVDALRSYERVRRYLGDEIGVEPSTELQELEARILRRDDTLLVIPTESRAGRTAVRGYELRDLVSTGPSGELYRAYQRSVGREVAVRVISAELADDPEFIATFLSDTKQVAALEHPNIAFVYDTWRVPGRAFQVSRWFDGGSLADRLRRRPLGLGAALQTLDQVGAALSAAHRLGVAHGRLGPSSVLFDSVGTAHLAGFAVGLPGLKATPERDRVDFAALAHEALAGRPPVTRGDRRVAELAGVDLPPGLAAVLDGGLSEKDAFARIEDFLRALRQAGGLDVVGPILASPPPVKERRNPYKGLRAFQEIDANDFYGRDDIVDRLLAQIDKERLAAVVGPSGSGKSSIVKAGLAARLRSNTDGPIRLITEMFPGAHPFEELEGALLRVGVNRNSVIDDLVSDDRGLMRVLKQVLPSPDAELVLVIDQFEELFAVVADEPTRALFLGNLVMACSDPRSQLRVVLTLRADFFGRPLEYPEFSRLVEDGLVPVAMPGSDALRDAIERPALSVGLELEEGLVPLMVRDVADQPGGLPLLQYALTGLVEHRSSDRLTLADYELGGGVHGALGRTAEMLYQDLTTAGQHAMRQALLRLVSVDEGAEDIRRRVRRVELATSDADGVALDRALQLFGAHRLLTFDLDPVTRGPTVEVAHEALIREWDRLKGWVRDHRDDLVFRKRLDAARAEWEHSGHDNSYLLSGSRLHQAEAWRTSSAVSLTAAESRLIDESRAHVDQVAARRARRRRTVLVSLSAMLVTSVVLAAVAWNQRDVATRRSTEMNIERLAIASAAAQDEDPDLAILLALEAYEHGRSLDDVPGSAVAAMQSAVQSSRLLHRLDDGGGAAAISPDGRVMAVGSGDDDREVLIIGIDTGNEIARFDTGSKVGELVFTADGSSLVVGHWDNVDGFWAGDAPHGRIFETVEYSEVAGLSGDIRPENLKPSTDGGYLAANAREFPQNGHETVAVWDLSDPGATPLLIEDARIGGWMEDNRTVVVFHEQEIRFVDVETGTTAVMSIPESGDIEDVDVHPAGELLFVQTAAGGQLWELDGVAPLEEFDVLLPAGLAVGRFSPTGDQLFLSGLDDEVVVRSVSSGESFGLRGHEGGVLSVTASNDGTRLVAPGIARGTHVWELSAHGPAQLGNLPTTDFISRIDLASDQLTAAISESSATSHRVRIFDLVSGSVLWSNGDFLEGPVVSVEAAVAIGIEEEHIVNIRDLRTGDDIQQIDQRNCEQPQSVDDQGRWLLCSGQSGSVVDMASGQGISQWEEITGFGDFGPSGTPSEGLLAVAVARSADVWVELRHLSTDTVVGSFGEPERYPWEPIFSADGRYLSFPSESSGVWVIDVEQVLEGETMEHAVLINPRVAGGPTTFSSVGGGYLATEHSGEAVRLWDLSTGEEWLTLPVDTAAPTAMAMTADGRYLYYADRGGVVRRFPLDHAELATLARQRVRRDFSAEECKRFSIDDDCSRYSP